MRRCVRREEDFQKGVWDAKKRLRLLMRHRLIGCGDLQIAALVAPVADEVHCKRAAGAVAVRIDAVPRDKAGGGFKAAPQKLVEAVSLVA